MDIIEQKLRELAEKIKQLKPEDFIGKEHLLDELDLKTKEMEKLYTDKE